MDFEIYEKLGTLLKNIQETEKLLYSRDELERKLKAYKEEYFELSKKLVQKEV